MNALPRFLCDEMLGHLCRYLRAAGYDALLARNGSSDSELLKQCLAEGRHFLTQDTLVSEHKAARGAALILPYANLDQLAAQLDEKFQLDWLSNAFTRCIVDNTTLVVADDVALALAPPDTLRPDEPLYQCPACRRIYWRGSHYKRMLAKLVAWQTARIKLSEHQQARSKCCFFEVWRLDDNANEFLVDTFDDRESAEKRIIDLATGGHKQLYWVKEVAA